MSLSAMKGTVDNNNLLSPTNNNPLVIGTINVSSLCDKWRLKSIVGDCDRVGIYYCAVQEHHLEAVDPNSEIQCQIVSHGYQFRYTACTVTPNGYKMAGVGGILSPLAVRQLIKQVSINIRALAFHFRAPRKNTRPA